MVMLPVRLRQMTFSNAVINWGSKYSAPASIEKKTEPIGLGGPGRFVLLAQTTHPNAEFSKLASLVKAL